MHDAAEHPMTVKTGAKIGYGMVLPVLAFLLYQALLIESLSGTGSWDGILLGLGLLVMIPGLLLAGCWVLAWPWASRRGVFAAGLALPAVLALVEYLWLYGSDAIRHAINAALVAPRAWVWLFVALMFVPLAASLLRAWRRRQRG